MTEYEVEMALAGGVNLSYWNPGSEYKAQIKDILNDIGALEKAVKVNNNFIDRLVSGFSLNEDLKTAIKEARQEYSETKNIQVIKKGH